MESINQFVQKQSSHTKKQFIRKQRGYSIIELSIALAIVSLILVGSLAGVQRVLRSNNVNKDLVAMNLLASKLTTLGSQMTTTTGVTMVTLNKLNAFEGITVNYTPAVAGGAAESLAVSNSFGGSFVVAPNTTAIGSYPSGGGWMIYSTGVPSTACPDILNGLSNLSPEITTDISKAVPTVTGDAFGNTAKAITAAPGPISPATLITSCTASADQGGKIHVAAFIPKG